MLKELIFDSISRSAETSSANVAENGMAETVLAETIDQRLERCGVSRRAFIQFCSSLMIAAPFGLAITEDVYKRQAYGFTAPRNFHANNLTVAVRYEF